jgi:hypothetical protein
MHHSYFANKLVLKKKDDAFNSYSNTEVSLSHLTAKSTSREKYCIPESKDVPIASSGGGIKSNTKIMSIHNSVSKRKNIQNNRYFNEDLDSTRLEKLLIKYDKT